MEYEVIIRTRTPYTVQSYRYEASDGKRYTSEYGVPAGLDFKKVQYETGESAYTDEVVFTQKVAGLDQAAVIKAINGMQ